jgi:plastocyanin
MRLAVTVCAVALSLAACGGDGSGPGHNATQLAFRVQPSASTAGRTITPAVEASLQDASGDLVSNAENTVTIALGLNPSGATLSGTTTVNAAGGVATFLDLQISKPGTGYTLSATSPNLTAASSEIFDVAAAPGVALAIAPVAGDGQTATVGHSVATNPSVKVTDGLGNPVANVSVTFSVASGGGSADGTDQTTDASGAATIGQWTLGIAAGFNSLRAVAAGLEDSSVMFTATATAGPAVAMSKQRGDNQTAAVDGAVAQPPSVRISDVYGNGVSGIPVIFVVASAGGKLEGGEQTTGTDGIATVGSWRLGSTPGSNTLSAASTGLIGSPVTFNATALFRDIRVEVRNNNFLSLQNGSSSIYEIGAVDTIAAGGTVTWVWTGQNHNVTPYQNGAFPGSGTHDAPFTYGPIAFNSPGTYRYRCTNHSNIMFPLGLVGMKGEIVVR